MKVVKMLKSVGSDANDFEVRINIDMIGINVSIPVPLAYHSLVVGKNQSLAI
tara:strand:+ start:13 stop:168 length:156 start_codon:yes stop_codon:yes gene_type:complete